MFACHYAIIREALEIEDLSFIREHDSIPYLDNPFNINADVDCLPGKI